MHPADAITLLRTSDADRARGRDLQRRTADGSFVRVRHGVYVATAAWEALDGRAKHLVRVRAVLPSIPRGAVLSHDSAAAVHGVPRLSAWPAKVHATDPTATEDVRRAGHVVHAGPVRASSFEFHGVRVAALAQTAVELARRSSFCEAAVILDHALRSGVRRGILSDLIEQAGPWGSTRAAGALAVCNALHESVGESYLAARCREVGAPDMVPQVEFRRDDGSVDRVDFWVPELGLVIEFDGRQKYEDVNMLGGRSGADVLWAEKLREDRIRAHPQVRGFVRVTWWHLVDPERLRALFRLHGVPCR